MELHPILQFISEYGYWIAIPLMILEGPITTMLMGFFASTGAVDIFAVIALGTSADMISDAFYYLIGRHAGPPILKRFKISNIDENGDLQRLKKRFEDHPGKIFFTAKILTGIAHVTFTLAGVTRVAYQKVFKFSLPGGLVWSTAMALLGFYFGRQITNIDQAISLAGIVFFIVMLLVLFYEFYLNKKLAKKYSVWRDSNKNEKV